ncbi:PEROXIDASE 72-RELATED [Salix purpurea]|uniref:Peroxidase n=1 Tax=Salix purpurea TaxID=77065 RepID=A0A9Q0UC97_SALPP|nr:PEROXIDASE 72-RELATED [Salix purpurea]
MAAAKAGATAFMFVLFLVTVASQAQLSPTIYDTSCPTATSTIRKAIRSAIASERRMAASLIRLHFHDCFVQGCDASMLLDETSSIQSEKTALGNMNSARGYNVIENAKTEVEKICPRVVSCADIIVVAAREATWVEAYAVKLGRRDSTTASRTLANAELPAFFEGLESLISRFQKKGLTARDMVALSGFHPERSSSGNYRHVDARDSCTHHTYREDGHLQPFHHTLSREGPLTLFLTIAGPNRKHHDARKKRLDHSKSNISQRRVTSFFEGLESLISRFQKKGLTARDMVALSGQASILREVQVGTTDTSMLVTVAPTIRIGKMVTFNLSTIHCLEKDP